MPDDSRPLRPSTLAVSSGRPDHVPGAPVNVPVDLSTTYRIGAELGYAREGGRTWEAFEDALGTLEGGRALVFASGLAAASAVFETVPVGGVVACHPAVYSGTLALLDQYAAVGRLRPVWVDMTDADAIAASLHRAELLWVESPSNPLIEVADIAALAGLAHAQGVRLAVDSTFATPILQRPLDLGADVVVHSATKYIGGHSDVLLGATVVRDEELLARLHDLRTFRGSVAGPFETWLALRGLRTLPLRIERASANALDLARRLEAHPSVTRVRYPGLPSHPQHALAARTFTGGFGAMLSIEVAGGADAAEGVAERVRLWTHATSLGGVESTLERRRRYELESTLVPESLLRLSVGIEDVEDLWADLSQALDR